jgi:hypothetical protein
LLTSNNILNVNKH